MILPIRETKNIVYDQDIAVHIPAGGILLKGRLRLPAHAQMLVIYSHGGDSSGFSAHDYYVTGVLNEHHIGTLLIDLLTPEEEQLDEVMRELHFDTLMLAGRLDRIVEWVRTQPSLQGIKVGYFCSSTCSAAALVAAAQHPGYIAAVVCQGGRPELAGVFLLKVKAPTLLLVGENDELVIELNRKAITQMNKQSKLIIIPHATHLFEEPGALEEMAREAANWFEEYSSSTFDTDQDASFGA